LPEPLLILTPTLGESADLAETVRSVEALSLSVLHVLVCPESRANDLRERFPRCRTVTELSTARGLYAAINRALSVIDGWSWFTCINDDDRLAAGFVACATAHCHPDRAYSIGYGNVRLIGERGQPLGPLARERSPGRFQRLWRSGIVPLMPQGTTISRRVIERLGCFDEQYRRCADLDFWVRASTTGIPFRYYDVHVADFRLRRGQLSADVPAVEHETQAILTPLGPPTRGWERAWTRTRYRLENLPTFAERMVRTGHVRTSHLYQRAPQ
jgi:hypothetical protein